MAHHPGPKDLGGKQPLASHAAARPSSGHVTPAVRAVRRVLKSVPASIRLNPDPDQQLTLRAVIRALEHVRPKIRELVAESTRSARLRTDRKALLLVDSPRSVRLASGRQARDHLLAEGTREMIVSVLRDHLRSALGIYFEVTEVVPYSGGDKTIRTLEKRLVRTTRKAARRRDRRREGLQRPVEERDELRRDAQAVVDRQFLDAALARIREAQAAAKSSSSVVDIVLTLHDLGVPPGMIADLLRRLARTGFPVAVVSAANAKQLIRRAARANSP